MTTGHTSRRYGMGAVAFCLAGASVYALMIKVTLAHIEAVSNQAPFDMRPFGYGPQDAARLLDALGQDGRLYYLTRQIPLDMIYPALLAMALVSAIRFFARRLPGRRLVRTGVALSVAAALFDYAENLGVASMILRWPEVSDWVVHTTSVATVMKSGLTSVAVSIVLLIAVIWVRQPKADPHP